MKAAPLEHVEAKIINFLRDTTIPCPASQIAQHIQETREETLLAIRRLVRNHTITGAQDLSCAGSTGETIAYVLTEASLLPAQPTVPAPRPRLQA